MPRRVRSNRLTRDEIVGTALRIVDEKGLDKLSMRRLGAALGVEAMALYRHVAGKEALLDLTVDRMRSEMHLAEPLPDDPAELLEAIFVEYRRVLTAHPNMLPLATRRTDPASTSGLEYLTDHGVTVEDAVELYQSLTALAAGFAILGSPPSHSEWTGLPEELAERLRDWRTATFRRTLRVVLNGYGLAAEQE